MNPDCVQQNQTKIELNEIRNEMIVKICDACQEIGAIHYFEGISCMPCMKFFERTVKNQ